MGRGKRGLFKLGVEGVVDAWNLVVCGVGLQLVDRDNRIALQLWFFTGSRLNNYNFD